MNTARAAAMTRDKRRIVERALENGSEILSIWSAPNTPGKITEEQGRILL